jgi:hypothetical protein
MMIYNDDCSTLLGDKHVDTIVTMYNLSELLLVMGSDGKIESVCVCVCVCI